MDLGIGLGHSHSAAGLSNSIYLRHLICNDMTFSTIIKNTFKKINNFFQIPQNQKQKFACDADLPPACLKSVGVWDAKKVAFDYVRLLLMMGHQFFSKE